ncbi:MAG TPA: hypothetical protein VNG53_07095, partial [Bacteroidia bacterium]|nr:hypothetical protein [Bacteroidia bacterium]
MKNKFISGLCGHKKIFFSAAIISLFVISSCKKDTPASPSLSTTSSSSDTYSSMKDFFAKNGVQTQTYTIDASTGGSFTTPKGTVVNIPANVFYTQTGTLVTGNVTIEFKDIYTKSDMLLSDMPTMWNGYPLKSGGEFFIRAKSAGVAVKLSGSNPITVTQPLNGWAIDSSMRSFALTTSDTLGWVANDSIGSVSTTTLPGYIFSLYSFVNPVDSGGWCNSDNPNYFSAYTQTSLMLVNNSSNVSGAFVFLLFTNLNSMVHVYGGGISQSYTYLYAPLGLKCTAVAIG